MLFLSILFLLLFFFFFVVRFSVFFVALRLLITRLDWRFVDKRGGGLRFGLEIARQSKELIVYLRAAIHF